MRVFKYRGSSKETIRRDLRTLFDNKIFAAPVETLNDLFEATVSIDGQTFRIGQLLEIAGKARYTVNVKAAEDAFLSELEFFVQTARGWGVYSLSRTAIDELLWAHYAESHKGFCLEYDLDELLAYNLENERWTTVDYRNESPVITSVDMGPMSCFGEKLIKKLIGTKSMRWQYEDEIRILTGRPGLFEYDYRSLKAIYFGARSTQNFRRRIMRAMAGRGLGYFEVSAKKHSYSLEATPINDEFARSTDYRTRTAPVEKGVPHWDTKILPYRTEILQAIEVVRRDPYCEKVIDAYLSSKGTPEKPIFYVTYLRIDGHYRNLFLHKHQLDGVSEHIE